MILYSKLTSIVVLLLIICYNVYFKNFQILVLEPGKVYMPSYITVNMGAEEKSIHIVNLCLEALKNKCRKLHEWVFTAPLLKSVRSVLSNYFILL